MSCPSRAGVSSQGAKGIQRAICVVPVPGPQRFGTEPNPMKESRNRYMSHRRALASAPGINTLWRGERVGGGDRQGCRECNVSVSHPVDTGGDSGVCHSHDAAAAALNNKIMNTRRDCNVHADFTQPKFGERKAGITVGIGMEPCAVGPTLSCLLTTR
ncbi:hypothetical protein RRG08_023372 [Elysia crispata]|uniref:Uncharacterized protein n=1 Tax=Elysia crispata TaxID=231223 RepID=A0AAE1EE95_9GAST|nr:hypothetical protein RRG08_023372 [Elysia crispata]